MQPILAIRRHSDGSIDFDFYRRRAMRRRRLARRVFVRHCLTTVRHTVAATVSAIAGQMIKTAATQ